MPTKREREYYRMGFNDGIEFSRSGSSGYTPRASMIEEVYSRDDPPIVPLSSIPRSFGKPKKRKLSAWNKFVKANSKKPRFVLRSGKLNLKKMGVAFRKTPAGKKKRR